MSLYEKMKRVLRAKSEKNTTKIIHLETVDSTNNYLRKHHSEEQNFTVVETEFQTAGRGQGTNTWSSEQGQNLLFSILIHPNRIPVAKQFLLSEFGALAIKEGLKGLVKDNITLKWPNDIYWNDLKLSGTLIETSLTGNCIKNCIFGIGLNINQTEFDSEIPNPVSLRQIVGRKVDKVQVLNSIIRAFRELYPLIEEGNYAELSTRYHEALYRASGFHSFKDKEGVFEATILEVEDDGHLVLRDRAGIIRSYMFKEIEYGKI